MFIGREQELASLEQLYKSDKFEFAVIYGRRRVGTGSLQRHHHGHCGRDIPDVGDFREGRGEYQCMLRLYQKSDGTGAGKKRNAIRREGIPEISLYNCGSHVSLLVSVHPGKQFRDRTWGSRSGIPENRTEPAGFYGESI